MTLTEYAPGRARSRAMPRTGVPVPDGPDAPQSLAAPLRPRSPASRRRPGAAQLVRSAALPAADLASVLAAAAITGVGAARGLCFGLVILIAAAASGQYRARICLRPSDQAGRLIAAAVAAASVLLLWTPPGLTLRLAGCVIGLGLLLRSGAAAGLRTAGRRGLLAQRALLLGAGQPGGELARLLLAHPELGVRPCGVLDDAGILATVAGSGSQHAAGLPLLGRVRDAGEVVAGLGITHVLVCSPAVPDAELVAALQLCRDLGVHVRVLPRLPELGLAVPRSCLDDIWGVPLIALRPGAGAPARLAAKRILDLTAGTALLMLTAPVMLLLAFAVRLDLRMPPVFRQIRVVGRGRSATISKLRTLRPGDPDTTWVIGAGQSTGLGRVLRSTHADELPQLFSVLRGDMSLVGPRPERPHFARQLARDIHGYSHRERVTAGLTGWAQVHGLTGDTSIEDRARFDNSYIEYWSVWLDLLILVRTLSAALSGALSTVRGGAS